MAFIVIDGIDGSGKATQAGLLIRRLAETGLSAVKFDFPRYGKPSAAMAEDYLNSRLGSMDDIGPKAASILFAVDRFAARKDIISALEKGSIVVSNRYVSSNQGHQAARISNPDGRRKFLAWLDELEYSIFGVPRPDLCIFLDVPPEIAYGLVAKKPVREYLNGKKRDMHESSLEHLRNAYQAYSELSSGKGWTSISCVKDGKLLEPEAISGMVWDKVSAMFH